MVVARLVVVAVEMQLSSALVYSACSHSSKFSFDSNFPASLKFFLPFRNEKHDFLTIFSHFHSCFTHTSDAHTHTLSSSHTFPFPSPLYHLPHKQLDNTSDPKCFINNNSRSFRNILFFHARREN